MDVQIKDWYVIKTFCDNELLAENLWGIVVQDKTGRFQPQDYICTSPIQEFNQKANSFKTKSGTIYVVIGDGKTVRANIKEFMLLKQGVSPLELGLPKKKN